MDETFAKALGRVIYNESIADITSKTEMNRVVELAGRRPDLEMWLLVCFCIFFRPNDTADNKSGVQLWN